ncbi:MAG: hypothetical protein ACRD7E_30300, partial [Bryobacteraceae bacterium]
LTAAGGAQTFQPGFAGRYRHEQDSRLRGSVVRTFTLTVRPTDRNLQWITLSAVKADGVQFCVWLLSDGYPPATLDAARRSTVRYIVQEGSSEPREYRNALTGEAVLPSTGAWEHLFPRDIPGTASERVRYLGHQYARESATEHRSEGPPRPRVIHMRPDLSVGPASNTRQKDDTRRYDGSDYEMVRLRRIDYREMAAAGINCVRVEAEQASWAHELDVYYWGALGQLPYPELLYRSQYLGPVLYLDEPAVGARDYALRPRLERDSAFRKSVTPEAAFDLFQERFGKALEHGSTAMVKALAARPDVDPGSMTFAQANLFSWETMVSTAAYQLSQHPRVPEAMVFEPPGRIGTRRTIPEIDMTYGVQIPADDPKALPAIIFGFLRGGARLTGKNWGVSIYGAVQHADTFFWLTYAYDLGATRFHFWDNYQLAAVPYSEYLAMARHLRLHANSNPVRNLGRLRHSAEVAILLPPGYNLGHVFLGKGPLWGVGELNLERHNRAGVKYRLIMSRFFTEVERCLRSGIAFDLLWDLPGMRLTGYRQIIRVRENGKVEVEENGKRAVVDRKPPARPVGVPPELAVSVTANSAADALELTAKARIVEKSAPVYYTLGADTEGVYHNARVAWELYGPEVEDYQFLRTDNLKPRVQVSGNAAEAEAIVRLNRPGNYRLRAATVDLAGRTAVVWRPFTVAMDANTKRLRLQ